MTREEAVEILTNLQNGHGVSYSEDYGLCFGHKWMQAYEMAITALRTQGDKDTSVPIKWIPVQEKLPERGQSVLILCKNKAMFTGYQLPDYSGEARWRIHTALNSARLLNRGRVTHWMPLPDVPEVEV